MPMLGLEKVFVNPVFSTSPVQAVLRSLLYQRTGTPFGAILRNYGRPLITQPEAAKIRYNAGQLNCNAKRGAKGAQYS